MKKIYFVIILSTLTLSSCSSSYPRIGGECDPYTDSIAENSFGATITCAGHGKWVPYIKTPSIKDLLEN